MVYCIFLLVLIHCTAARIPEDPRFWFSSTTVADIPQVDFRGCYGVECVYVSSSVVSKSDKILAPYVSTQKMWAVADAKSSSLSWILSDEIPAETPTTLWVSPVASFRVIPSQFDASPYLSGAPDPLVAKFVASISEEGIKSQVEELASRFFTRNSLSSDAIEAAQFLEAKFQSLGCQSTRLQQFRSGYSPNVICELPGFDQDAPLVVVGAHYDSRASRVTDPTERAPGADDNGSGTSSVLEILRTTTELKNEGVNLRRNIVFMLFSGEEQGLYGSAFIASQMRSNNVEIQGMVNLDMIGYPQQNAPTTLYWRSRGTNKNLTDLGIELTKTYLGEDTLVTSSTSCCSDQQSFTDQGYASTGVSEATAATNNPNYHKSSDLPSTMTFSHARRIAQMTTALIATLAEPHGPEWLAFLEENNLAVSSEGSRKWKALSSTQKAKYAQRIRHD